MQAISIAQNFSTTPGGRTDEDGPNNGQRFREKYLLPAVKNHTPVQIDLDGVAGLPGSFCDEAFAALVRQFAMSRSDFDALFKFSGKDEDFSINKRMIDLNVDRAVKEITEQ